MPCLALVSAVILGQVGTYSCHGVEPSYSEDDGVTAKINQDRGCVVYPFKNDPKHALFSVFDGKQTGSELFSRELYTAGINSTDVPLWQSSREYNLHSENVKCTRRNGMY